MPIVELPPGLPSKAFDPNQQAPGAWPKDTLVEKAEDKPGDMHPKGTRGRVVGSIYHPEVGFGYFVLFDSPLGLPVFVRESRLQKIDE